MIVSRRRDLALTAKGTKNSVLNLVSKGLFCVHWWTDRANPFCEGKFLGPIILLLTIPGLIVDDEDEVLCL